MRGVSEVQALLDERVRALGFELVEAVWAGSAIRPILRLRIDVPEARVGEGAVSVADCATVSRGLEAWLDELPAMPARYVLEVSSPGLERPLTRGSDWVRFAGQPVAVSGPRPLAGRAKRLEGELVGLHQDGAGQELVKLRLPGGEEVNVPKKDIERAHLVFRWK